jgi:hypothetical protein
MRIPRPFGIVLFPLLSTCGGSDHGTLLVDRTAREAGALVEIADASGALRTAPARTLPYRLNPGETAVVSIGARQVSVDPAPGTAVSVTGPSLTVEKLSPKAIEVTSSETAAQHLASTVGARVQKRSSGVFLIEDGAADIVGRASEAENDAEITDVRAVPVPAGAAATAQAAVASPAPIPTMAAAAPLLANTTIAIPPPSGIDTAKRYVQFYGYCGSWMPSPNSPFQAEFPDGSVATGRTDRLGLVILDNAPSMNPRVLLAGGVDLVPPRPYTLDPAKPETLSNVQEAMHSDDVVHLAWSMLDAAQLARTEWSDKLIATLAHPHAGVRVLAAVALLRYPTDVQDRALASIPDPRWRDDVAYVFGRVSSRPAPAPIWASMALAQQ